jgi:hypothetical protein
LSYLVATARWRLSRLIVPGFNLPLGMYR